MHRRAWLARGLGGLALAATGASGAVKAARADVPGAESAAQVGASGESSAAPVGAPGAAAVAPAGATPAAASPKAALPPELLDELPAARLQGEARMRWLGLRIYDIRLWSARAPAADPVAQPLALELRYARALDGAAIAERSLAEMRRIRPDLQPDEGQRWLDAMRRLFPDVAAGDRLTGVHRPQHGARFFHNGRRLGDVPEPAFTRAFFGIWLSDRTSAPDLRAALLRGTP